MQKEKQMLKLHDLDPEHLSVSKLYMLNMLLIAINCCTNIYLQLVQMVWDKHKVNRLALAVKIAMVVIVAMNMKEVKVAQLYYI